jgi:hypothetical protein
VKPAVRSDRRIDTVRSHRIYDGKKNIVVMGDSLCNKSSWNDGIGSGMNGRERSYYPNVRKHGTVETPRTRCLKTLGKRRALHFPYRLMKWA